MTRIVTRRTTLEVSHAQVRRIAARASSKISMSGESPGNRLLISGMIFHSWNQSDPTDFSTATMACTPFLRGYNWSVWKSALLARIAARGGNAAAEIVEDNPTNTVQFFGQAVLDVAAMCDLVMLRPGTPVEHVASIKARSRIGTKVITGLWNFESVSQMPGYTPAEQGNIDVGRAHILNANPASGCTKAGMSPTVNGWNSYSCNAIDKYEMDIGTDITSGRYTCAAAFIAGRVACPHTPAHASLPATATSKHSWECDVRENIYIDELIDNVRETDWFDGVMYDNVDDSPYPGSALNAFPTGYSGTAYRGARNAIPGLRTGWKGFLQTLHEQAAGNMGDQQVWGNTEETLTNYTAEDIRNRWYEHGMRSDYGVLKTVAQLETMFTTAQQAALRIQLGVYADDSVSHLWTTTTGPGGASGTWADVLEMVRARSLLPSVYVQAARSTSASYIYWQPQFRDLA